MKNFKIKKRHKGLKENSFNSKVFSIFAYLLNETVKSIAEGAKDISDLFCEYTTNSIVQKFHGVYYSKLEDSLPSGEEMNQAVIKKAIKRLELLDYIEIKQVQGEKEQFKFRASLTEKGVLEFLKYKIKKEKKKKWDGKWRIIIFDILENQRQIRDLLRIRLRWLGYKELQKSVWIFPYNVEKEIREILEVCDIDIIGDVRFLIVEGISEDEDLKQEFGLK